MITEQQLVDNLNKYYGIKVTSLQIINRLMFRQSFLITTSDGIQYIVKDYSNACSLDILNQMLNYLYKLKEFGVRVSFPIRKLHSNEFHFSNNNRYYVVFVYVEGSTCTTRQYKKIASSLKIYHKTASSNLFPSLISTEKKLQAAKDLFLCFNNDNYSIKQEILSCKTNLFKIVDKYISCSETIIHGDSILENMILSNNNIYLIDFDSMRRGDALEDVANTILSFMYFGSKNFEIQPERAQLIEAFINCYFDNTPPDHIKEKLHYYIQVHCVIELIRHAENIRFLVRMPSMKDYLLLLVHIIRSENFKELMYKDE